MKGYRLKKPAYFLIFTVIFALLLTVVYAVEVSFNKEVEEVSETYTETPVYEENIPVITTDIIINRPYVDNNVKILKGFYDHKADEASQENSIIYYESTYMQNSSVAYGGVESFDVVSILDGKVIKITKDDLVGKYLHGEQISSDVKNGFGVLKINGISLGGYKANSSNLNNYYPKGLRNF